MHAFILAGGYATRLWPLTEKRAKPLLPLVGIPLLTHLIQNVPKDVPVTVSTNAAFQNDFEAWAQTSNRTNLMIRIEETKSDDDKLGALGALAQWITQERMQDDILLLAGDNYLGFDMKEFLRTFQPHIPLLAAIDVGDLSKASAFGTILLDSDGTSIAGFEEKPREPKSSIVSTGCSIIPKDVLPLLIVYAQKRPDNIGGIFEECLRRKIVVQCSIFDDPWFDIGSFASYLHATRALVGERVLALEDSHLSAVQTQGSVVVGQHSCITNSTMKNTVIFEHCDIEDCCIEDCIIDDNCVLKGIDLTGKMLRAGTRLVRST